MLFLVIQRKTWNSSKTHSLRLKNAFHKQKPEDKVQYIENLIGNTLMIGDGLNDADAHCLKQISGLQ
jgi:cation transport ATPase